jgi:hypothetical protein
MRVLLIQTACFLFNIGVSTFIFLWFAQYNRKRIDLSQGASFNWQGMGASQFIVGLPVMFLPILIVVFFKRIGLGDWGLGVLALLGVTGILCHNRIIQILFKSFVKSKYAQAEGFRSN